MVFSSAPRASPLGGVGGGKIRRISAAVQEAWGGGSQRGGGGRGARGARRGGAGGRGGAGLGGGIFLLRILGAKGSWGFPRN